MSFHLSRRHFLAAVGATAGSSLMPRGVLAAQDFVAATFGGSWANVQRELLAPYFSERTGASVSQSPMLATEQIAKLTASKGGRPPFDVAMLDEGPALEAIDAGLIAKFDPSKSRNFADLAPDFQGEYGPAITMQTIGIAYNPETVTSPPTSWEDLWKLEYRGRVGITSLASTLGLAFLLDINRLEGGTEANMDAGFRKLKSLLPNLAAVSANFGAHGALFQQGEIDIGVQNFNFAEDLKAKGVPIEFVKISTGTPGWKTTMHVVEGATQPDLAYAYIDSQISPKIQGEMVKAPWNVIPTNSKVPLQGLVAKKIAATPADLEKFVFFDWRKVNENRSAWTEQFNRDIRI